MRTSPYLIHTGCIAYDDLNMHIHMHSDNVVNPQQTRRYPHRPTTQLSATYARPMHRKSLSPRMMLRLLCCGSAIWLPNKSVPSTAGCSGRRLGRWVICAAVPVGHMDSVSTAAAVVRAPRRGELENIATDAFSRNKAPPPVICDPPVCIHQFR